MEFRIGLFVIAAMVIAGTIVVLFGEIRTLMERHYTIAVHFASAPGIVPKAPVLMNGVMIGSVRDVVLDQTRGGVAVLIDVRERFRLRKDTEPRLMRSLLGDSSIDFTPGTSSEWLPPSTILEGKLPVDPIELVQQLDQRVSGALDSFGATSDEWRRVAQNLNQVLELHGDKLDDVVEQAIVSLDQFGRTMQTANLALENANRMFANPESQAKLRATLDALPQIATETQQTIAAVRQTVKSMNENLDQLKDATAPLAERSQSIVTRLDGSLANLHALSGELKEFVHLVNKEDGTFKKLAADPELYRNLNRSAESMSVLLKNLEPIVSDFRVFSDKIARHPELIGVGGVLKGSSGLKEPVDEQPARQSRAPKFGITPR
jgi:phospholipid/cholesterol/gamma-HCH transport system substrate-binding protein